MSVTAIERKVLSDLVDTRLKTLTGVAVYRGEVPGQPPVIVTGGQPDSSGRVGPYVVQYGGAGGPSAEADDVAYSHSDLVWPFQVTCAHGWEPDCLHLVDRVYALLFRWVPVLEGLNFGQVLPPPGFDPGTAQLDRTVKPARHFVPLQFLMPVTT